MLGTGTRPLLGSNRAVVCCPLWFPYLLFKLLQVFHLLKSSCCSFGGPELGSRLSCWAVTIAVNSSSMRSGDVSGQLSTHDTHMPLVHSPADWANAVAGTTFTWVVVTYRQHFLFCLGKFCACRFCPLSRGDILDPLLPMPVLRLQVLPFLASQNNWSREWVDPFPWNTWRTFILRSFLAYILSLPSLPYYSLLSLLLHSHVFFLLDSFNVIFKQPLSNLCI